MFTDKFLKVPIDLVNEKQKDLTGDDGCYEAFTWFSPFDLAEYHETESDGKSGTQIYLKNGRGFMINLTIKEFEKALNEHQK